MDASSVPGLEGPSAASTVRANWKRRLEALFSVRAPHKTQTDIENALQHFSSTESGGWDEMWRQALAKYGPEPNADEVRRAFWRNKLSAYFLLVDSSQTPDDIEECLDFFEHRMEGFEGMWMKAQKKYGLFVDSNNTAASEAEKCVGDIVVERNKADVLSGVIEPRVVVMVLIGGISYRLYQSAPPSAQFKFNSAVASEVKFCAEFPNPLTVVKVSEHVDGMTLEMETKCPQSTQVCGSLLVHYINAGAFPTGLIRKAYLDHINGNPSKVFVVEGAVVESRQTANYRGNLMIRPGIGEGGRPVQKLPSIDESRDLVMTRKEAAGMKARYAYVLDQQEKGPQALYEPRNSSLSDGAEQPKRYYPPPLANLIAADHNSSSQDPPPGVPHRATATSQSELVSPLSGQAYLKRRI